MPQHNIPINVTVHVPPPQLMQIGTGNDLTKPTPNMTHKLRTDEYDEQLQRQHRIQRQEYELAEQTDSIKTSKILKGKQYKLTQYYIDMFHFIY